MHDCEVLERVFDHGELEGDNRLLPRMEVLMLEMLPKLRLIFCNEDKNDNMRYLLSPSRFKDFHYLKELHIIHCGMPLDEKVSFLLYFCFPLYHLKYLLTFSLKIYFKKN